MKKFVRTFIAAAFLVAVSNITAFASAEAEAVAAGTGILSSAYQMKVITEMTGRAGAAAPAGAKGIAFEVLEKDLLNLENILSGAKTTLSASSIDPCADLVTKAADGTVIKQIQCKAGTSNSLINKTLQRVIDGGYKDVELVGTKETAEAFNKAAAKQGVEVTMKASKVSNNMINTIARKALGDPIMAEEALRKMGTSAILLAVVETGVAGYEAIRDDLSAEETVAHMTIATGRGAINGAAASAACSIAENVLILVGAGTVVKNVVPVVIMVGSTVAVGYLLDNVIEETHLEEVIAKAAGSAKEFIVKTASEIKDGTVKAAEVTAQAVTTAAVAVKDASVKAGTFVKDKACSAYDSASIACAEAAENIGGLFTKEQEEDDGRVLLSAAGE